MRVAIAGSSGVVGSALRGFLLDRGDDVVRLVRPESDVDGVAWDPRRGTIDADALEGVDAVVNLAGRSIGAARWTEAEKKLLWESRVDATSLLVRALGGLSRPPSVLVNASAVGFYGDGGAAELTEESPPGAGFLADLTVAWEEAALEATAHGIRVATARSGIVLSKRGGALARLLAPFGPSWLSPYRWGLGGPVAGGRQWWSWISLVDEVRALAHVLDTDLSGPVNLVSPQPTTNREFTKALGRALRRPAVLPIPGFVLRVLLGSELAEALVLDGQRALPRVLTESGFGFEHPDLDEALTLALR